MKGKRGFTLIELLVVLGLAGIVISVVMSFFIANYKNYERINNESELQYQSQFMINYMTNKILGSKKIVSVNKDSDYLDNSSEENIEYISFQYGSDDSKCHNFKVENHEISYGNDVVDGAADSVFGSYVDELKITPLDDDFEKAKSIKIHLKLRKNANSDPYEAEQIVYMRNSK